MPRIPDRVLDCCVYLYKDQESARSGHETGGSGFIVGVQSRFQDPIPTFHCYVVSTYHVAVRGGFPVVRVNANDGGTNVIALDCSDWHFCPDGGDVAVALLPSNKSSYKYAFLPTDWAVEKTQSSSNRIGLGDDAFIVGRFFAHDGGQTNKPALRFGHISIEPSRIAGFSNGESIEYYALDMPTRSGFSGSPVFAYRLPGADFTPNFVHRSINLPLIERRHLHWLGIHCGQFKEERINSSSGEAMFGYSGMAVALPAWKVVELLNSDPVVKQRIDREEMESQKK